MKVDKVSDAWLNEGYSKSLTHGEVLIPGLIFDPESAEWNCKPEIALKFAQLKL